MLKAKKVERTIATAIVSALSLGRSYRAGLGHIRRGCVP